MARHVRFMPDGSNPTRAIRSGFYARPPAFGGRLAPGEADAEARITPVHPGLCHETSQVPVLVKATELVCFLSRAAGTQYT